MELTCYLLEDQEVDIQPARARRRWMDDTPHAYAYRCLPLSIANAHGWEIRSPATFEAEWNGGPRGEDIQIRFDGATDGAPALGSHAVASHFGSGILTFVPSVVLRTPPGLNLWVTGPANRFKDGIQPLSAVIESDWMPYTFTMNWKFTRPGEAVRFRQGEPFCFFFPVPRHIVEDCTPVFRRLVSDAELTRAFELAYGRRLSVHDKESLDRRDPDSRRTLVREDNWYMRGVMPDGSRTIPDHQKKIRAKPFIYQDPVSSVGSED